MIQVLSSAWALLLGMGLLMIGNGMQSSLLGIRGEIEGFDTFAMSMVMSAYFLGFLGGSRMAPGMIRRVGHVRVFAALASLISAVMILYPTLTNIGVWIFGAGADRVLLFGGVCDGRKLAERCGLQRDTRTGAVAVYDRANFGDRYIPVVDGDRRSVRLRAVRDPFDPCEPRYHADFAFNQPHPSL